MIHFRKLLLATVAVLALYGTASSGWLSSTPTCGDQNVLQAVEDLSRQKAINTYDQMNVMALSQLYNQGALAQMGQAILNGECNPRNGQPCPGESPVEQQQKIQVAPGTGVAPPNQCQPRDQPPVRNNGVLAQGLQLCPEFKPRDMQAEQQQQVEAGNKLHQLYRDAMNSFKYTFSAARSDGEVGNKNLCSVNIHVVGHDVYGKNLSNNWIASYSVQTTDDGHPYITLIEETAATQGK